MTGIATTSIVAAALTLSGTVADAMDMACTHPDDRNHTYTVAGDRGTYTWNDHGVERAWALECNTQRGGSVTCHRWEEYGDDGRSVLIFRMLSNGSLIEAGSWALLNVSTVDVKPGFVCTELGD